MTFIQIIEFQTNRIDEVNTMMDAWLAASAGKRTATRAVQVQDRENPGTYLHLVEFPSYEAAMENSNRPETGEFAARLAELFDSPPTFRNLDVIREEQM